MYLFELYFGFRLSCSLLSRKIKEHDLWLLYIKTWYTFFRIIKIFNVKQCVMPIFKSIVNWILISETTLVIYTFYFTFENGFGEVYVIDLKTDSRIASVSTCRGLNGCRRNNVWHFRFSDWQEPTVSTVTKRFSISFAGLSHIQNIFLQLSVLYIVSLLSKYTI